MFLGLRQTLAGIPAGTLEEEIVKTVVQFPMKLTEIFPAVSLSDTMFLPLIVLIACGRHHGLIFAFAATELLQRWLSVDVAWLHKGHDLSIGEIVGPAECFLSREGVLEREFN